MPASCLDLLRGMMAIESVNAAISGRPDAERRLVDHLEPIARGFGLGTRRLPVPDRGDQLLVTLDRDPSAPWLLFESHLDTVGVEGMTVDPFGAHVVEGRVHGRGACDTKGSGAAMLWAMREVAADPAADRPEVAAHPAGAPNVALLFAVDEEISRTGIDTFMADHLPALGWRPAAAVVGEPTRLRVVAAHTGVVRCTIRTTGLAAHSSHPSRGRSAIRGMLPVLDALEHEYIPGLRASHPLTGPAVCSVNVIRGGEQVNIIPATCEIQLDRRTVPGEDGHRVLADLEALLARLRSDDSALEVELVDPIVHPTLDPATGQAFVRRVSAVLAGAGLPQEPSGVGYGSDASALAAAGVPAVVLGPGDIAQAHSADEWLELDQLERGVEVYAALMRLALRPD